MYHTHSRFIYVIIYLALKVNEWLHKTKELSILFVLFAFVVYKRGA